MSGKAFFQTEWFGILNLLKKTAKTGCNSHFVRNKYYQQIIKAAGYHFEW